jgi:hypothetical protein
MIAGSYAAEPAVRGRVLYAIDAGTRNSFSHGIRAMWGGCLHKQEAIPTGCARDSTGMALGATPGG